MKTKSIICLLLFSISLFAQKNPAVDTLTVKMSPAISTRVVLYGAEGAKQKYITYADSDNGVFKLAIPKSNPKGMYRLVFNQKTMDYLDFLFVNKSFEIQFNPTNQDKEPLFKGSATNETYSKVTYYINKKQQQIDSLQVLVFQSKEDSRLNELTKQYIALKKELSSYTTTFYQKEKNKMIKDLVKANMRIQPEKPIKNPEKYLPFIKSHYYHNSARKRR